MFKGKHIVWGIVHLQQVDNNSANISIVGSLTFTLQTPISMGC